MERFVFRPINLVDIASTLGIDAAGLRLTSNADGVVEVDTPNLTAAKRSALRSLFTTRGYVEDTTGGN